MIALDTETKVLDTEILPQHTIASLALYLLSFFSQAFTAKINKHTHIYTR